MRNLRRTQCKRKVLLQMSINLARVTSGKARSFERNDKAGNDSLKQFAHAGSLFPESQIYQTAKHRFRKARNNQLASCADRWEKSQISVSTCRKNNRTYGTMESWDLLASGPQTIHKITPQQRQEQFGNQRCVVQTTAGGSNTIPARHHPELGQAHRARMDCNFTQRATGKQASGKLLFTSTSTAIARLFFSPQNSIQDLAP